MPDIVCAKEMLVPQANIIPDAQGFLRKWLVCHKTGGGSSAQGVARWFQSGAGGTRTSVHYIVGMDGEIVQCVREKDGAAGNCCLEPGADSFWPRDINLNLVTFSIEGVDPTLDNSAVMPSAQKDAYFWLVKDICTRWHIPMRQADRAGGIAGHNSIAPRSRARCPGEKFLWGELWEYLKGAELSMLQLSDPMGKYFKQIAPDRWLCRNGIELAGRVLAFYRRHAGILGLPLTAPVVHPGFPDAKLVVCEAAVVADDPGGTLERGHFPPRGTDGCYLIHLDGGLGQDIISRPVVSALEQEITKLKSQINDQDADVMAAMKVAMKQIKAIATQYS